jgi:alkyl sulfatase BDS1-like metallo-beta-lactamase superfamily hydrolase
VADYLSVQRDLYAYLHDQTLRMINEGYTGIEAAELMVMPPALERAWHTHGYYGSVSHNVKAIYQRYIGWFDGNPATLWQHPPAESSVRYVDCMGGPAAVIARAEEYAERGDLRFSAELLNRVVFADPEHVQAKELLADVYDRLGYGSENGTWRNFYLMGAFELRNGVVGTPAVTGSADMLQALSVEQMFDAFAVRVHGPRSWDERIVIDWRFTDLGQTHRTTLRNGVLTHRVTEGEEGADLTLTLTKLQMVGMLTGNGFDQIGHEGDLGAIGRLIGVLDAPDGDFPIVTP